MQGEFSAPFSSCPLLLSFPTVNSLLLRPFSPLTITCTYLLLPVHIRMKKSLRNMCSLFQGLHPWRNWLPHPNANSSEFPRAYQLGMGNASPALLRFRLAWSCAGVMHCRLWCCERMRAMALPCPSKESYISFSCPLFCLFFFFFKPSCYPFLHLQIMSLCVSEYTFNFSG